MPGKKFPGAIVRNSGRIDSAIRTLKVEVDVDNSNGAILPSSYVSVHFAFLNPPGVFTLPARTLLFRSEGLDVVLARDNHAVLMPITVAPDNGKTIDVSTGANASDVVIVNPSDSIVQGQSVKVNHPAASHGGDRR